MACRRAGLAGGGIQLTGGLPRLTGLVQKVLRLVGSSQWSRDMGRAHAGGGGEGAGAAPATWAGPMSAERGRGTSWSGTKRTRIRVPTSPPVSP